MLCILGDSLLLLLAWQIYTEYGTAATVKDRVVLSTYSLSTLLSSVEWGSPLSSSLVVLGGGFLGSDSCFHY